MAKNKTTITSRSINRYLFSQQQKKYLLLVKNPTKNLTFVVQFTANTFNHQHRFFIVFFTKIPKKNKQLKANGIKLRCR